MYIVVLYTQVSRVPMAEEVVGYNFNLPKLYCNYCCACALRNYPVFATLFFLCVLRPTQIVIGGSIPDRRTARRGFGAPHRPSIAGRIMRGTGHVTKRASGPAKWERGDRHVAHHQTFVNCSGAARTMP